MTMRRRIALVRETMRAHKQAKRDEAEMSSISGERLDGMRPAVHLDVGDWGCVLRALDEAVERQRNQNVFNDTARLRAISERVRRQLGPSVRP